MSKEGVFTMKLEPQLRADFMAATAEEHRPASQVMRELMRDYIKRRSEFHAYDDYLHDKVKVSRVSKSVGLGRSNDKVEEKFAAMRNQVAEHQS